MIQMTFRTQGRGVSTLAEAGQGGEEPLLSYAGWGFSRAEPGGEAVRRPGEWIALQVTTYSPPKWHSKPSSSFYYCDLGQVI